MNVKDNISSLKKDFLIPMARIAGITGYSKLKKQELIDLIYEAVLSENHVRNLLLYVNDEDFGLVTDLVEGKAVSVEELYRLEILMRTGYLHHGEKELIMCEDAAEIFKKCLTEDFWEEYALVHKVLNYCDAFSNLYGVIPINDAYKIYDRHNKGMGQDKFREYISIAETKTILWDVYDDSIVSEDILEFDVYDDFLDAQIGGSYYIPSNKKLIKYAKENYFDETNESREVYDFLCSNLGLEKDKADEIMFAVQYDLRRFGDEEYVMSTLKFYNVIFKTVNQKKQFEKLLKSLSVNTRQRLYRGFTVAEALGMESDNEFANTYRALEQNNFNVPYVRVDRKIGRNEPCPCGSGKKYKRCCGKKY